jgi:hypothetical protein
MDIGRILVGLGLVRAAALTTCILVSLVVSLALRIPRR